MPPEDQEFIVIDSENLKTRIEQLFVEILEKILECVEQKNTDDSE